MAKLKDQRFYQQVIITTTDGTTATYTGPVQLKEGAAVIRDIKIISPIPLPPDCSFGRISKDGIEGES